MNLSKENIFMISIFLICLVFYSILLFDKIEYFYIFIISLSTESFFKAIYDIKNETGNNQMYIYSKETNQKLRYLVFFVSSVILFLVASVIYNKIIMPEVEFSIFILFNAVM